MKNIFLILAILFAAGLTSSRAQDTWTQKANFGGTGRYGSAAFSINGKGYMGCGYDFNSGHKNDFWEYDPSTDVWTQKANFGGLARETPAGFAIGSKGYIGCGYHFGGSFKDFYEYDPVSNTWTQKADFGGTPTNYPVGLSIGSKGYIGTGGNTNGYTKDFWEYDPSTNTWTKKADFGGEARALSTGFSINTKGYIGTGQSSNGTIYKDFWEYDPSTNTWTQKADFGGGLRGAAGGFSIGSSGYITMGGNANGNQNDLWQYNPSTDLWVQKANFPGTARSYFTTLTIGDKGYIGIGDIYPNDLKDFWEYDPGFIATGSITGSPFCPEVSVSVPFTSIGTFNSGNVYTAQLSSSMGKWGSPTSIGFLSSTANAGTIMATMPSKPKAGTKYRIRVISSDPPFIGSDNGINLEMIPCNQITGLSISGITSSSATLSWTVALCAVKYRIQYRIQGTTTWTTQYSNYNTYLINGLPANTHIEFRLQTYCSASGSSKSGFTSIQTFMTSPRFGNSPTIDVEAMKIYPNPANDHATIQFTLPQSSHVSIKVYDVNGKEIATLLNGDMEQGEHSLLLNTNQFSKGVYLMKMISDFGMMNEKLIVQ